MAYYECGGYSKADLDNKYWVSTKICMLLLAS